MTAKVVSSFGIVYLIHFSADDDRSEKHIPSFFG